jgi:hypothetical protein
VGVHCPADPHSSLNLEYTFDRRLDRCPPARPEFYNAINKCQWTWTRLDEDDLPIADPKSVPEAEIGSGRLVLYVPNAAGVDICVPATIVADNAYPYLDVTIQETELLGGVMFGRNDGEWGWALEDGSRAPERDEHP